MIARSRRRFALAALAGTMALLAAPSLGAQQMPPTSAPGGGAARHDAAASLGPTVDRAAVGARSLPQQPTSLDEAETAMQARLGLGQARALMIVGFSAVIIGLLIGDDAGAVIAIAGAAVGLYGLYYYLK